MSGTQFRERNPWLAFEEAFRTVRGFIQRLDAGTQGPIQARLGEDLRSLGEGAATAFVGLTGPTGFVGLQDDPNAYGRTAPTPRIRLVLGQPPMRPNLERLAVAYHATSWVLGREAAMLLPIDGLAGASLRGPWAVQATTIGQALEAVEPALARDGRVIQFIDGGPEAIVATVLGGATAGYRLLTARLADPDDDAPAVVELIPPGGRLPPGSRTRANVGLEPLPGGAGDPGVVPARGLFSPPEGFDDRPFSATDAARTVTEVAVEALKARGEPARFERILGEIRVGLDRAGQLRRFATATLRPRGVGEPAEATGDVDGLPPAPADVAPAAPETANGTGPGPDATPRPRRTAAERDPSSDAVERLLALIRDELARPTQRRLVEIEPGRWWLADADDLAAAATPLADRVEWAVYSLLSTAGPIAESAFFERMATMFTGPDLADAGLIRASLDSYRSLASTPERMVTGDDLLRRSQEHTDLLATIAGAGHRLGMRIWIGRREQTRRLAAGGLLGDLLEPGEERLYLGGIGPAVDDIAEVDAIWYVRGKAAFLFEVEWTAMLGETLLRRHAQIPPDDALIRFLVVAPERADLVRYKLDRSPLLRAALDAGTWHVVRSDQLRAFLARDPLDLADLEPYLGLHPTAERRAEQMPLF
jgi:hypothetical protein